jgi:hypothetical protein
MTSFEIRVTATVRLKLGLAAAALSVLICSVGFLIVGFVLPVWFLTAVTGSNALLSAPGHGGGLSLVTLFFTVPLAGIGALTGTFLLAIAIYKRLYDFVGRRNAVLRGV